MAMKITVTLLDSKSPATIVHLCIFLNHPICFLDSPDTSTICCAVIPLTLQSQSTASLSCWIPYELFHFILLLHSACGPSRVLVQLLAAFGRELQFYFCSVLCSSSADPFLGGCRFHFCPLLFCLLVERLLFMASSWQLSSLEVFSKPPHHNSCHPFLKTHSF